MLTLAHIRDDPAWSDHVRLSFSDLIAAKQAAFVSLRPGDLVLSLAPGPNWSLGVQVWALGKVYRVSSFEETGDAFDYSLDLECTLSVSEARPAVTRDVLLQTHNWFPDPEDFFKPLPRAVWTWLREVQGIPLPHE